MRSMRVRALVAALTTAALLTAGCGQKPGVAEMAVGVPGAAGGMDAGTAAGDGLAGAPGTAGDAGGLAAGGAGGSAPGTTGDGAAAGTSGGAGAAGGGGGSTAPGAPTAPRGGGDTTGVTATTIKIGVHAPVTGAAAFPQQSFERGIGVYADYINRKGGIHGRKLEIVFRDDRFDPNSARSVCKEMAEQQKVFMLVGGGGADQIDACARYAAGMGVPYLSAGVHETRPGLGALGSVSTYFAASLTYEQQVPLIARVVASQFKGQKVAVITADNDSLNNYHASVDSAIKKVAGSNVALSRRIPKKTDVDAPAIATQICNSGAKAVVWNASPSGLINVSKSMTCQVTFVGPGLTNGLNIVATAGCPTIDGALFYSPFPGLDRIDQMDPTFRPAYRQKNNAEPDDLAIAVWGLEKLVGQMLQATGKQLSRESFMSTIARTKAFTTGVYPVTNFSSRFGGTAMHLLEADCGSRQYRTVRVSERP
ncbi:MAG TPA: ABC transporter substrate-binding protein [Nocardioidaceae bacterium]|nr:ABC transporter substrate-binding protein [Nocardioidaceae bacterium]